MKLSVRYSLLVIAATTAFTVAAPATDVRTSSSASKVSDAKAFQLDSATAAKYKLLKQKHDEVLETIVLKKKAKEAKNTEEHKKHKEKLNKFVKAYTAKKEKKNKKESGDAKPSKQNSAAKKAPSSTHANVVTEAPNDADPSEKKQMKNEKESKDVKKAPSSTPAVDANVATDAPKDADPSKKNQKKDKKEPQDPDAAKPEIEDPAAPKPEDQNPAASNPEDTTPVNPNVANEAAKDTNPTDVPTSEEDNAVVAVQSSAIFNKPAVYVGILSVVSALTFC